MIQSREIFYVRSRDRLFRRFGYDPKAAVKFVLACSLPLKGKILEIGTGRGRFTSALDLDREIVRFARRYARALGVACRIRFLVSNALNLGWSDEYFDAVASMDALHHIKRPEHALAEMMRVTAPGGKLVIADFSRNGFRIMDRMHRSEGRKHERTRYRMASLERRLKRAGWQVRKRRDRCHQVLVGFRPLASRI
jgi:ubiquinone/menaquinone biosynthesis C-methylase UbiE